MTLPSSKMSELSSSSASGASDYDKISGIEPLSQSSASGSIQSSSQLKAKATEKYLTTGRLTENAVQPVVPSTLNQPPKKNVKAYFTKSSTVIQYTAGEGVEAVPIVRASIDGVANPPASWTVEAGQAAHGPGRPKGARVKLFQEGGGDPSNISTSETKSDTSGTMDRSGQDLNASQLASNHGNVSQNGTTEVVVIPTDHNGDDNQSLSSIDQAINMALERAHEEESSFVRRPRDDIAGEDMAEGDMDRYDMDDVSQQEISQTSFTSSSRNDSAMDESIDRSDFEGAQALADEYILQTRGYQPDLSDEEEEDEDGEKEPARNKSSGGQEFSALHLEVSSAENSNLETLDLQLRPYRYSDCSDLHDQSENAEADQYHIDGERPDENDIENRSEQDFPVRLPATGMSDSQSLQQPAGQPAMQAGNANFQARLQTMLAETARRPHEEQYSSDDDVTGDVRQNNVSAGAHVLGQGVDPRMLQQSLAIAQAMARSAPDGGDELRQTVVLNPLPLPGAQVPPAANPPNTRAGQQTQRPPKMGTKGLKTTNAARGGQRQLSHGEQPNQGQPEKSAPNLAQGRKETGHNSHKGSQGAKVKGNQGQQKTEPASNKQKESSSQSNSNVACSHTAKSVRARKASGKSANSSVHSQGSEGSVRSRPGARKGKGEPSGARQQPAGDTATVKKQKMPAKSRQQQVEEPAIQRQIENVPVNYDNPGYHGNGDLTGSRHDEGAVPGEVTPPRQAPRAQRLVQHVPGGTLMQTVPQSGQPGPAYSYVPPHPGVVGPHPPHHGVVGPHHLHGDESLDLSPIAAMSEASARYLRSPGAASAMQMLHNLSLVSQQAQDREQPDVSGVTSTDIANMEDLRNRLQGMLKLSSKVLPGKSEYDETNEVDDLLGGRMFDTQSLSSVNSVPYFSGQSFSSMSTQLDELLGPHHTLQGMQRGDNQGGQGGLPNLAGRDMPTILAEIQSLQQKVEKEKFRRKHCEKQIKESQNEVLELQQQLAVAVSTDRKKDFMIEQLDKTLARVIDGWKRKESNKQETINELAQENGHLKEVQEQQKQLIDQFERELSQTVEQLSAERQSGNKAKAELEQLSKDQETERSRLLKALELERERLHALEIECSSASQERDKFRTQFNEVKQNYQEDEVVWREKEADYTKTIDEITEKQIQTLEEEKSRFEKQEAVLHEAQRVLTATQKEVTELNIQLDTALREKESQKVEMGLAEARAESNLRKVETELRSLAEKEMAEKLEETHARFVKSEETIRERHRQQVTELSSHHKSELEAALARYHEDSRRLEDKHMSQVDEYEERIEEMQSEIRQLKSQNRTLENKWNEVTNKLQSLMQQNCNEALKLLKSDTSSLGATLLGSTLYSAFSPSKPSYTTSNSEGSSEVSSFYGNQNSRMSNFQLHPSLPQQQTRSHEENIPQNDPGAARVKDVSSNEGGFRPLEVDQSGIVDPDLSQYSLTGTTHFDSSVLNSTVLSQVPQAQAPAQEHVYPAQEHVYPSSFLEQTAETGSGPVENGVIPRDSVPSGSGMQGGTSVYPSSSFQQFQQLFSQAYSQAQASITAFSMPGPNKDQEPPPQSAGHRSGPSPDQKSSTEPISAAPSQPAVFKDFQTEGQGRRDQGHDAPSQGYNLGSSIMLHPPVHLMQSTNFDAMATQPVANPGPGFPSFPPTPGKPTPDTGSHEVTMDTRPVTMDTGRSFLSSLLQQAGDANTSQTSYTTNGTQDSDNRSDNLDYLNKQISQHQNRQDELQHYIKMLLNRSPGGSTHDDDNDVNSNPGNHDDTLRSDTSHLAFSKTTVTSSEGQVQPQNESTPKPRPRPGNAGGISPEHAGEIARLLGLYRQGPVGEGDNMETVMGYLQGVQDLNENMQPTHDKTPPPKGGAGVRKKTGRTPSPRRQPSKPASPKGNQLKAKRNLDMAGATRTVIKIPTGDGPSVPKQKPDPPPARGATTAAKPQARSTTGNTKPVSQTKAVSFQTKPVPQPASQGKKPERKVASSQSNKQGKSSKQGVWK